jgi:hypothetical protein
VITSHPHAQDHRVVTDDVTHLNEEIARLRGKLDRREAWKVRGRRAALTLLIVLGCGLVAMSLIAWYVRATVLNSDRYVDAMSPIARSAAVQDAVATKIDNAIESRVDFDSLIREALPDQAAQLAPAFAVGLQQILRNQINDFVHGPRFPELWDDANRRAHERVVELLTTG